MSVFEKLKNGDPVDMMSEEYRPAIAELHRADRALFHLNHFKQFKNVNITGEGTRLGRYGIHPYERQAADPGRILRGYC